MEERPPRLVRILLMAPWLAGAVAVAIGALVLIGWALDVGALKGLVPGYGTMKPNTALGFLTVGGALWILGRASGRGVWLAEALAVAGALLHGATLVEYIAGWNLGIDTLLFPDPASSLTPYPGRPSPATATNFTLCSLAILVRHRKGPGQTAATQLLASAVGLIAFTALGAYLLDVEPFYGLAYFVTGMAIHTASAFLLLAIGLMALRKDTGIMRLLVDEGTAGLLARRLVPATILLPLLVGFFVGEGHRLGWFDFAFALTVTPLLMLIGFGTILSISLTQVRRFEQDRDEATRRLQERELEQLREQDAFRIHFLNTAAHELSTPMTPLVIHMDLLERSSDPGNDRQQQALIRMRRAVDRLRKLAKDLIVASQLQGGAIQVEPAVSDMPSLLARSVERWRGAADKKGLALDIEAAPGNAMADMDRLAQIMDHLLDNAVKFTTEGKITVVGAVTPDMYRVEVVDTGRGFDPEDQMRLFRAFSQVHETHEVTEPGSGLGLFICQRLVEMQGGVMGATSEGIERGARVWFSLPLAR